ncbi:alanine racemase [Terrilactibacillus sp. BCM23-1]|uniref:Alanine racemase n=1 Tax=Terrilactibacillus tamarindi TaxID=2599694 RepID=A0A6N8CSH6_9BACI|nr:alanine racemase [Terrilactibacillus tamarindi]MTT33142.1 alanine racemase [Terrilactibacillus tamarindi]
MEESFYRDTWATIDLDAIEHNVSKMKEHLPEDMSLMGVVKANAYGHGAVEVAKIALASGAEWLSVALLDEAIQLREAGIKAPILILSSIRPKDISIASKYHISLTVYQKEWVEEALTYYHDPSPVFLHVKCDTGMGRIGVRSDEELVDLLDSVKGDSRLVVEGAFTHFATADEKDESYFDQQFHRFNDMVSRMRKHGVDPNIIHCGNSAATLKYPTHKLFNLVRFGVAMYGMAPSPYMRDHLPFPLKPAFRLYSRLTNVKQVEQGTGISYGQTYHTKGKEWIGTIPIGYADGWSRSLSNRGSVLIDGEICEIVGRVCMDQLMCKLPKKWPIGECVTLIGEMGDKTISVDDIANLLQTINYEVVCMISYRVPRIYLRHGKQTKVYNPLIQKKVLYSESKE